MKQKEKEYRQLCNKVRKEARKDKEKWLHDQCREIERNMRENRCRATYKLTK